jgi:hypothetical protein
MLITAIYSFRIADIIEDWRSTSAHDFGVGAESDCGIFLNPIAGFIQRSMSSSVGSS